MGRRVASVRPRQRDGRWGAKMDTGFGKARATWGVESGGRDRPVSLTEAYLDASAGHEHRDRIYTVLTPERARARRCGTASGRATACGAGPLDGVPISWKDLFDSAGTCDGGGIALLEGRVPMPMPRCWRGPRGRGSSASARRICRSLRFPGLGLNPAYRGTPEGATPPNVNGGNGVPGGSSSGAAASVAFGLRRRASGRTPAGRCASRRRSTTWWGSRRPMDGSATRVSCRWSTASTRSGRSAGAWRIARRCWRSWTAARCRI
jgi:hypothetical protein